MRLKRLFMFKLQARRDLNPQPTDLESAALPLELLAYLTSLCEVCFRHAGQNFFIAMRSVDFLFLVV